VMGRYCSSAASNAATTRLASPGRSFRSPLARSVEPLGLVWIYLSIRKAKIPPEVIRELLHRLVGELTTGPVSADQPCQGPLLSRIQYRPISKNGL
jgi:hypothetical protein